ncbi:SDR family NAD(P)-dependent oxidoreductase [Nocardia arthritidis]|uniref:SDR family NAD(P)-dependent oxidoreductase n=1 Tax=Nocardia arthritidis TaxID=228602 RepID=A0A6G9YT68_9NOCA|nr:SDR family NAD(P)-dependent oxidoreductase [Nocardia arthritidis]
MAVNYFGTLNVIRDALPDLHAGDRDSITVISSMAGVLPCFGYGAYSPSKFAVRALCEVLRQELKPGASPSPSYCRRMWTPRSWRPNSQPGHRNCRH